MTPRFRPAQYRWILWSALAVALAFPAFAAMAEPVKGQVDLPRALKTGKRHSGYWRIENGAVAIQPSKRPASPVVVLEGLKAEVPAAKTYAISVNGFAPDKRVLVVAAGSVVEITNNDKVPHDFSIPSDTSLMPLQRQAPGSLRRVKFASPGSYSIRCNAYPGAALDVLVVSHEFYAPVEDDGRFQIKDAPSGKATLKVWVMGRFVHEESIDVAAARNLTITVDDSAPETGGE